MLIFIILFILQKNELLINKTTSDELQPGLRNKIVFSGILPYILELGRDGHIQFHRHIEEEELEITGFLAKGAGGKVHKGLFEEKYAQFLYLVFYFEC